MSGHVSESMNPETLHPLAPDGERVGRGAGPKAEYIPPLRVRGGRRG